jgi:predicted GNAT family N-acyltransferase
MITFETYFDINEAISNIRREVFMEEQGISEKNEFEGGEDAYIHFCIFDNSILIGYIRILINDSVLHVGRVAVKYQYRKQGVGKAIMIYAEEFGRNNGCTSVILNAQMQAKGFYSKLGYFVKGEVFKEAGIDHIQMAKSL